MSKTSDSGFGRKRVSLSGFVIALLIGPNKQWRVWFMIALSDVGCQLLSRRRAVGIVWFIVLVLNYGRYGSGWLPSQPIGLCG